MTSAPQLVVGTAGHIDHGKSRLVMALTGTDPDRLPEEKARGMTIDLGFAHTDIDGCDVWFVDVPGHERFIRNMVAGATGIDLALLVVAADDSVMPQTREHAELLGLLGLERCVVVLTKLDLVDEDWAEQVVEEADALLRSNGITPVGSVRTSAQTGRGLHELRSLLAHLARDGQTRAPRPKWFRLPIDRSFTIAGRGTVVTGSVAHGEVARDAELELFPTKTRVRVRDLQSHHDSRDAAVGRMRLAINLAAVPLDDVRRGCELATPGYLRPTRICDVQLASIRMPGKTRRQTLRTRLHIATSEVLAELRLAAPFDVEGSPSKFGQLRTAEPIVAAWGQHFVVRDESGMRTLGGGRVLNPLARPWTARRPVDAAALSVWAGGSPVERVEQAVRSAGWQNPPASEIAAVAGLSDAAEAASLLDQLVAAKKLRLLEAPGVRLVAHAAPLIDTARVISEKLTKYLRENPRLPGIARAEWPGWMPRDCPARLRPALAEWFLANKKVAELNGYIVPLDRKPAMSAQDEALLVAILAEFDRAEFQPPALEALRCTSPRNERRIRELVALATVRGDLVRVSDDIWLHARRWVEVTRRVAEAIRDRGPITVADIRTLLNSTRKFTVPLAEQLDAAGVTRRSGDQRFLGPNAPGTVQ